VTALAYVRMASAGFIWDDDAYVTQNENLRSLAGLARIWLDPRSIPQYYPLVHTSFWIETRLWGLHPAGFHLTNVLLHAVNALLLWRVLAALAVPGAYLAAAIFAVHPVMVESVAWVTERKNVLSMALALGSIVAYLRFAPLGDEPRSPRPARAWAASLGLYALALLGKSVVCSVPAVVLVLTWWKRGRVRWNDVKPLLPFFALGIVAAASTIWLERHHVGAAGEEWSLAPVERVLVAGRALWFYAGKLAWPHPLIFFYPRWQPSAAQAWQFAFPVGAAIAVAALWRARHRIGRGALAAVLVFAGVLFPALGFFDVYPFRYSFVADHFQYHASAALIALFAAVCARGAGRFGRAGPVAACVLVAALALLTFRQTHAYRDLETLYRDVVAKNERAWNAHLNLANLLSSQGRNEEALPFARDAARLAPELADAHNTLGGVLFLVAARDAGSSPRREEALRALERAIAIEPDHRDALYNAAVAALSLGRPERALPHFERLLALDPASIDAREGIGRSLLALSRPAEAVTPLRDAVRLAPDRSDLRALLAEAEQRAAAAP